MKDTARVIITLECERKCEYCCNKYKHILDSAQILDRHDLTALQGFKNICVTGGEPMLCITSTFQFIQNVRSVNKEAKIYLYTAQYKPMLSFLLRILDGVHFTLHKQADERDIFDFHSFQRMISMDWYKHKSFRLYVHPEMHLQFRIMPWLWKRVEIKPWLGEESCKLPDNEVLFIIK